MQITQKATTKRTTEIALHLGIADNHLVPYGHYKAKISLDYVDSLKAKPGDKLVLVTATSPTPAGEGKTTTAVGCGVSRNRIVAKGT